MLKHRLIAVILVRDKQVIQTVRFKHTNVIHSHPIFAIESFNRWAIDEIIVLNVSKNEATQNGFINIIHDISEKCFVPLSVGGWINKVDYARELLASGADKIVVNTHAFNNPKFISDLAKRFGTQCIIVSIDSKIGVHEKEFVAIDRGSRITNTETLDWAKKAEFLGAGEIFINSVDFDGNRKGYNLKLIKSIVGTLSIPVIAMGGVLKWEHLAEGIVQAKAAAVAAANIFHYTEHSTKKAKKYLLESGLKFRKI